jgi:hypothetical protein
MSYSYNNNANLTGGTRIVAFWSKKSSLRNGNYLFSPVHIMKENPELVFTELILQYLYWICEIVIHSRVFVLDLPSNIDL